MHLRKLVLACGFASLTLSNVASALGLGEITLKSPLNQPLSAEVQLLDTKGLSPEQIIVSLGTASDFERNGLDYVHFYSELRFEVALNNPGGPVVRITSTNPVREPFLNFLIEAKWTSGRLLREYTLLMDLPTFDDKAPGVVQAAPTSRQSNPASQALADEIQAAVDAEFAEEKPEIIAEQDQPAKKSKAAVGTYGPVGGKDTLWDIALAVRPDSSTSVHQTMLALQRLNPDAFIRGNINLLKKGQVLRVPDAGEINSITRSEAVRQFNTQVAEWSGNAGLGAQLDASRRTTSDQPKSEAVAGRVKLEAPTSKDKTGNGQGSGANAGSGKALESELAATLEELEKAKSEKTELSSRVRDLEDQVKTMQRLVDVSNEKLRALQLNSAKQPEIPADVPGIKPTEPEVAVPPPAVSEASSSSVAAELPAAAAAASVAPKKPAAKPAAKPAPKPAPEKSIIDLLKDNILYVGIGLAAILAAIAFVVIRRRKSEAEEGQSYQNTDDLFASEPNFDHFNQAQDEVHSEAASEESPLFEENTTAVAETGDVVGEADIYIAYGKFDQAEEMLLNGLAKDPSSTEIRLKLLEIYSHTRNLPAFDQHYAAILPLATGFALGRAKELRASIPGAGEFTGVDVPQEHIAEEPLVFGEDFNLDDELSHEEVVVQSDDHDLRFDLDLDDNVEVKPTATNYGMDFNDTASSEKASVADDEFLLDFDLDETKDKTSTPEDLSEISLALDDLDEQELPDDIETSSDEEFSFDFSELEELDLSAQEKSKSDLNADDADDFNFDSDVNNLDLAALDTEMEGFDAELDKLDEDPLDEGGLDDIDSEDAQSSGALDDDLADLDENLTFEELESLDDLDTDSELDEGLVELDDSLETELDDTEFNWEESEADTHALSDADELNIDDDFDIDAPLDSERAGLVNAELSDENVDDESAIVEEDLTFAELDELNAAKGPVGDSTVAANEFESTTSTEAAEDDLFEQALSDFSAESLANDPELSGDDLDAELDFMADADEAATKLDLARAYIDMGDSEGARDILAEVAHEGNEQQRQEAVDLLSRIDA